MDSNRKKKGEEKEKVETVGRMALRERRKGWRAGFEAE